jgi:hypothetical protein
MRSATLKTPGEKSQGLLKLKPTKGREIYEDTDDLAQSSLTMEFNDVS